MDAQIVPEPSPEEREALLAALAEPNGLREAPDLYLSPWRLAGLPGDADEDV